MISPLFVSIAAPTLKLEYGAMADCRAFDAARTKPRLVTTAIETYEVFQQLRCQFFDSFGRLQHFGMGERLARASCSQIGDARHCGNIQSTLPGHNHLWH